MDLQEFTIIKNLLEEIRDLLKEQQSNQQPTTKITVVGNKAQSNSPTRAKGFDPKEDFQF